MEDEIKFLVKLASMEVVGFNLKPPTGVNDIKEYQFVYNVETKVNETKKLIVHIPGLEIFDKRNINDPLGSLKMTFAFEVDNFEDAVKKTQENRYYIDTRLDRKLAFICLNTLRGVAYSMFNGSYLQNALLPLLIEEDNLKQKNVE